MRLLLTLSLFLAVPAFAVPLEPPALTDTIAAATEVPDIPAEPTDDVAAIASLVLTAVTRGNWAAVAALAVVLLVWAARRFGGGLWPWLLTPRGGATLVLLWSIAGAMATALLAGQPLSLGLVLSALTTGAVATGIRKLLLSFATPSPIPAAEAAGAQAAEAVPSREPLDIANGR